MILLDTNAVIWLERRHPRAKALQRRLTNAYISPATLLELQYLAEAGRIEITGSVRDLVGSHDWQIDDPPAAEWFQEACDLGWTRDPFDRLIVAHAAMRGWRLATGDQALLSRLPASRTIAL